MDRIFLPFVRLGTGATAGSGIGLSIVKTVVEQYEGSVTVDSIPGEGSTFYVQLPVILWKPSSPPAPVQPLVTELETGRDSDRPRALMGKEETSA
jgi:hypothetical protein